MGSKGCEWLWWLQCVGRQLEGEGDRWVGSREATGEGCQWQQAGPEEVVVAAVGVGIVVEAAVAVVEAGRNEEETWQDCEANTSVPGLGLGPVETQGRVV